MIRAVFFDWFNTLAQYYPPREEMHATVCRDFGIEVSVERIRRSLPEADRFFYKENSRSSVEKRPPQERAEVYAQYEIMVLRKAGVEVTKEVALEIIQKVLDLAKDLNFVLFDDVLPTFKELKRHGLVLGIISNIDRDIMPLCYDLGLAPYLDFVVTAQEAGADKPHSPIFLAALERARVKASEAIYVGDQYDSDIVGARGVGIKPLLLDRNNLFQDITDCPRIEKLTEIVKHL